MTDYFTPSVKLIAMTAPLILKGDGTPFSAEDFVVYVARVSNPDNQMNTATAPKLIRYLLDNGHFSPFEIVNLVFEIETTRDISRQILRHEFRPQEFSQRYQEVDPEPALREPRWQDTKNRQNSIALGETPEDRYAKENWDVFQNCVWEEAIATYKWAIKNGFAKEQARAFLPEGLTKTTLIGNWNLRDLIFYIKSRTHESTQKEHRMVAEQIKGVVIKHFPNVAEALGW